MMKISSPLTTIPISLIGQVSLGFALAPSIGFTDDNGCRLPTVWPYVRRFRSPDLDIACTSPHALVLVTNYNMGEMAL
jgi:hypothetical protein